MTGTVGKALVLLACAVAGGTGAFLGARQLASRGHGEGAGPGAYPAVIESAYMDGCRATAGASGAPKETVERYCGCTLRALERTLPLDDFQRGGTEMLQLSGVPADQQGKLIAAMRACRP